MSFDRYRSDLLDLALGAGASGETARHVAACPRCAEGYERMVVAVSRRDDALRLEGEALPGPQFLTRLRESLAAERAARPWMPRILLPVLASLLALGVGLLLKLREPFPSGPSTAAVERPKPPTPGGSGAAPSVRPVQEFLAPARARHAPPRPSAQPVLVDANEGAALADLAARLASGRTRPESLEMPAADSAEMKEIAIAPIDLKPLDVAPVLEDSTERSPS